MEMDICRIQKYESSEEGSVYLVLASSTLDELKCLFATLNDTGWDILIDGRSHFP